MGCGEQQLGRGGQQHAVVAEGMFAQGDDEFAGHQSGVAGGVQEVFEGVLELLDRGRLEGEPGADAVAEGYQILVAQFVLQA